MALSERRQQSANCRGKLPRCHDFPLSPFLEKKRSTNRKQARPGGIRAKTREALIFLRKNATFFSEIKAYWAAIA
jgi:hypothetical protein